MIEALVPDYVAARLDREMKKIREAHPEMTDDEAKDVRAQLVWAFHYRLMREAADKIDQLNAENERLREALREIAKPEKWLTWDGYPSRPAAIIAQEALDD